MTMLWRARRPRFLTWTSGARRHSQKGTLWSALHRVRCRPTNSSSPPVDGRCSMDRPSGFTGPSQAGFAHPMRSSLPSRFAVEGALQLEGVTRIVIFTSHLSSAKLACDPSVHSSQGVSLAVCRALLKWFAEVPEATIDFVDVPTNCWLGTSQGCARLPVHSPPCAWRTPGPHLRFCPCLGLKPSYFSGGTWLSAVKREPPALVAPHDPGYTWACTYRRVFCSL